jgi:hypothetical protein
MATASTARAAPAARVRGLRSGLAGLVPAAATVVGVAALLRLVYDPWFLNYDARFALLWARDLAHGFAPEYGAAFAPTPHPLQTAVALLTLPFGEAADDLLSLIVLLSFGALTYLAYRLGAELFSPAVGVVAALTVLTRPALERDALLAYQDVPFAALVVGATLLEARAPKRGWPVLAVLAVAGLLRPEAWALSFLYVAWIWRERTPRERALLLALAASAPVVWSVSDWIITGDPLHSLHGTADLAETNNRRRRVDQVPFWTAKYFGYTLREPLVVGVPIGLAFAWRHARRPSILPLAVVAALTAAFVVGPVFGLPLIRRYVGTPAALLCVFYGLAVCGWLMLPPGRERRRWRAAGVVAAALSVAFLPWHVGMLGDVHQRIDRDGTLYADLRQATESPAVKAAFAACPNLTAGDHRPIPFTRLWLDGDPGSVTTVEDRTSPMGRMLLMPLHSPTTRRIYNAQTFPHVQEPRGWRTVYANRSWRVSAAPECR